MVALAAVVECGMALPTARLGIKVVDEEGVPVSNADVAIGFDVPSSNLDTRQKIFQGKSDEHGRFTAEHETDGNVGIRVSKIGHYAFTGNKDDFKRDATGQKWLPWNDEVLVVLKTIKKPIPMYAYKDLRTTIPKPNVSYGFDLMLGDWIAPMGKGKKADINIELKGFYNNERNYNSTLVVTFPNQGDGIQVFETSEPFQGSMLRSPHFAPEKGYKSKLELARIRENVPNELKDFIVDEANSDQNYIFRIRTKLDENEKVLSTYYGKIYGGFRFAGAKEDGSFLKIKWLYVNPRKNDKNIEFDTEQNLNSSQKINLP